MKLNFEREKLLNALSVVSKAIPGRTTNDILECALFNITDEGIIISANNNELGIETKIDGISHGSARSLSTRSIYPHSEHPLNDNHYAQPRPGRRQRHRFDRGDPRRPQ